MKGDFSRLGVARERHYDRVLLQQGRVLLDADWNAQVSLGAGRSRTTTGDVLGPAGGPMGHAAFGVRIEGGQPWLGPPAGYPRRYYVDGILCEQEQTFSLWAQPDRVTPAASRPGDGRWLLYLDVAERHVTGLEDEDLLEPALGGPDTTTRVEVVWRVLWREVAPGDAVAGCAPWPEGVDPRGPTGMLRAQAVRPEGSDSPCIVSAEAGYRRLSNQTYRVEVHRPSTHPDGATFKWSRENGSVVAAAKSFDAGQKALTLVAPARDQALGFANDQWVEVTHRTREIAGKPGFMAKILNVEGGVLTLKAVPVAPTAAGSKPLAAFDVAAGGPAWIVRRWDHAGAAAAGRKLVTDEWLPLEDGVQVEFVGSAWRSADHWIIPARTHLGDVVWPQVPGTPPQPMLQPPIGVEHHYAKLAVLERVSGTWKIDRDLRRLFPPSTEALVAMAPVRGEGQEARPGQRLPAPVEVRVTRGRLPWAGARVRFAVEQRTVWSADAHGGVHLGAGDAPAAAVVAQTDGNGVARAWWTLASVDPGGWSSSVIATLLATDPPTCEGVPAVRFDANQSVAREVHYTDPACVDDGRGTPTLRSLLLGRGVPDEVQGVLDALLCELQGSHVPYADPGCDANTDETDWKALRALLFSAGVPEHLAGVLDALLCRLHAGHVPFQFADPGAGFPFSVPRVEEVRSALDALLRMFREVGGGLADVIDALAADLTEHFDSDEERCRAIGTRPVEGPKSLLDETVGMVLDVARILYVLVLQVLDLDARSFTDLLPVGVKLGDNEHVNLPGTVHGEGFARLGVRAEERFDLARDLLDRGLRTPIVLGLTQVLQRHGLKDRLVRFGRRHGDDELAWNGPAARDELYGSILKRVTRTDVLDHAAMSKLRAFVLEVLAAIWQQLVRGLLCTDPPAFPSLEGNWLLDNEEQIGRAVERALRGDGLTRGLVGLEVRDMRMVPALSPGVYPDGVTWVLATAPMAGGREAMLLARFGNDGAHEALNDLERGQVLPPPGLGIRRIFDGKSSLLGFRTGRKSVYLLVAGAGGRQTVFWHLPSEQLAPLTGDHTIAGSVLAPTIDGQRIRVGQLRVSGESPLAIVEGRTSDPAAVVALVFGAALRLQVHLPFDAGVLEVDNFAIVGPIVHRAPASLRAFSLASAPEASGTALAVYLESGDRRALLICEGRDDGGAAVVPWWDGDTLTAVRVWDLPAGWHVVGGAHDQVVINRIGTVDWTFVSLARLTRAIGRIELPERAGRYTPAIAGRLRALGIDPDKFVADDGTVHVKDPTRLVLAGGAIVAAESDDAEPTVPDTVGLVDLTRSRRRLALEVDPNRLVAIDGMARRVDTGRFVLADGTAVTRGDLLDLLASRVRGDLVLPDAQVWHPGQVTRVSGGDGGPWIVLCGLRTSRLELWECYTGRPPHVDRMVSTGASAEGWTTPRELLERLPFRPRGPAIAPAPAEGPEPAFTEEAWSALRFGDYLAGGRSTLSKDALLVLSGTSTDPKSGGGGLVELQVSPRKTQGP